MHFELENPAGGSITLRCFVVVQIQYLKGIKYLYQLDIFLYCMMGFVLLTLGFLLLRGPLKWKRSSQAEAYAA